MPTWPLFPTRPGPIVEQTGRDAAGRRRAIGAATTEGSMTMTGHTRALTLVLGGTGKTGRRVAQRLIAHGKPVRIGARSGGLPGK